MRRGCCSTLKFWEVYLSLRVAGAERGHPRSVDGSHQRPPLTPKVSFGPRRGFPHGDQGAARAWSAGVDKGGRGTGASPSAIKGLSIPVFGPIPRSSPTTLGNRNEQSS